MAQPARNLNLLAIFCFCWLSAADPFLQKKGNDQISLIDELEGVLGVRTLSSRLDKLEARLEPMFRSLPKTSGDRVGHATARYALHRISLDMHGWTISGLEANATTFNTTSLIGSGVLSVLPAHVEGIFGKHVSVNGFGLQDLAILAATVVHLVHDQEKQALRKACEMLDLPTMGPMAEDDMKKIIQIYMTAFLQAVDVEKVTDKYLKLMPRAYPGWADTVMLLDDERETAVYSEKDQTNPFLGRTASLQVALRVVERVADHFALNHAEPECQEIKEDLLSYERGGTGRIRLVDFYRAGLNSRFFYTESKEYLRSMGALDESDGVWGPKVIVSNYVLAKSNCLADSSIYSICCFNECESLYGHLERSIEAPEAMPEQIAGLVARLSSSTVQAPRNLSQTTLPARLDEIASGHGGKVLLHSRLFAQWMHQAFPRECPYPHLVGTTTNLGPLEWEKLTGQKYKASPEDLDVSKTGNDPEGEKDGDLMVDMMWTSDDEHFVEPRRSFASSVMAAASSPKWWSAGAMLGAILSFAAKTFSGLGIDSAGSMKSRVGASEKYFV